MNIHYINNNITKIQRQYLYKKCNNILQTNSKLIKTLNSFTEKPKHFNLFNPQETNEKKFIELKKILTTKNNIAIFDNFTKTLKRFFDINNISAKKIMSAWMIASFPEFILGKSKENIKNQNYYPDNIHFASQNLINNLTNFKNKKDFFKSLYKYTYLFNFFLETDKNQQINQLISEYIELSKTNKLIKTSPKYSKESKIEIDKQINTMQQKIIKYINMYDKSIQKNYLEMCFNISLMCEDNFKKAYIDILIDELNNKKVDFLEKIINEICTTIITLGGEQIDNEIKQKLDAKYISSYITNSELSYQHINNYGDYLVNMLSILKNDKDLKTIWELRKEYETEINIYLSNMLLFILEIINI